MLSDVENRGRLRVFLALVAVLGAMLLLSSCAAGPNPTAGPDEPAGFWLGLWHGIIIFFTFVVSLFTDDVSVYEVANSGNWYDVGFVLGAAGSAAREGSPDHQHGCCSRRDAEGERFQRRPMIAGLQMSGRELRGRGDDPLADCRREDSGLYGCGRGLGRARGSIIGSGGKQDRRNGQERHGPSTARGPGPHGRSITGAYSGIFQRSSLRFDRFRVGRGGLEPATDGS